LTFSFVQDNKMARHIRQGDRQGDGSNVYTDLASIVKFRHFNPACHHKATSK
jgi:hypothetical protein